MSGSKLQIVLRQRQVAVLQWENQGNYENLEKLIIIYGMGYVPDFRKSGHLRQGGFGGYAYPILGRPLACAMLQF